MRSAIRGSRRRPPLVGAYAMPRVATLRCPDDFYWILAPAPLSGMSFPRTSTPWTALHQTGFRWVVCLSEDEQLYDPAPLQFAFTRELDDLSHGGDPSDPDDEERVIRDAVRTVVAKLKAKEGVIVHCDGGTGRTGTVIACALRVLGDDAESVVEHLDELHRLRGKRGWTEPTWQSDLVRRFMT